MTMNTWHCTRELKQVAQCPWFCKDMTCYWMSNQIDEDLSSFDLWCKTTSIYFFADSTSTDLEDNAAPATPTGNRDSSIARVGVRESDSLQIVKRNRRKSPIIGTSPADQALMIKFGVELKQVANPKGQLVKNWLNCFVFTLFFLFFPFFPLFSSSP